ncbi:hypothetical protein TcCL_Unassigned01599 [Trypanosoma cruzi]|nr:hypothetical protein TcCL_Unassigned01599 [Trypanosoma cruzi]
MMRGRLHLLAAPASSAGTKMQVTLCCTHCGRCTSFTMAIASCGTTRRSRCAQSPPHSLLSLPPRTHRWPWHTHRRVRKNPAVFTLLHFEQQHRQTHVTPHFADSPQTRLLPHSSSHRHAIRKRHAAAPHDSTAHTNTAPRHSAQAVSGHTEPVAPVNDSPLQAVRQDPSATIKQSAPRLLLPPCTRFCLPHASSVTPGLSISTEGSILPSAQREAH